MITIYNPSTYKEVAAGRRYPNYTQENLTAPDGYEFTGVYGLAKKGEPWLSETGLHEGTKVVTASSDYKDTPDNYRLLLRPLPPVAPPVPPVEHKSFIFKYLGHRLPNKGEFFFYADCYYPTRNADKYGQSVPCFEKVEL